MRVKLLAQHFIDDQLHQPDEILDVSEVTPLMEGLDAAATAAIAQEVIRVYGRWISRGHLLDNPPIIRTLDNAQPVPSLGGGGPPR